MRWTWAAPALLTVMALVAGRAMHLGDGVRHAGADHAHSHGHWHADVYHDHGHGHEEGVTRSLADHSRQPHEHGFTNAPAEESVPATLIAVPARRNEWKPGPLVIAPCPMEVAAPAALDAPLFRPPPRSRAGPAVPQLAALRSTVLQV